MKNQAAILLLAVHLMAYTNLEQILKFPKLVDHFLQHRSQNNNLGFIDFLEMHYCTDSDAKADDDDMKLPFKVMDFHIASHVLIVTDSQGYNVVVPEKLCPIVFYCHYIEMIPVKLTTSLLRPPIFSA